MASKSKNGKGEIVPTSNKLTEPQLKAKAMELDAKIRAKWEIGKQAFLDASIMLKTMWKDQLHRFIPKKGSKKGYESFEEYVDNVTGGMARGKVYQLLAIAGLLEGPNPLPEHVVRDMPQGNAYELTRLEPQERTPDIVEAAVSDPPAELKQKVQAKINMTLPEEERRDARVLFARNWSPIVIDKWQELEDRGVWMEGVRDGDKRLTLQEKFAYALLCFFESANKELLDEADRYRAAHENSKLVNILGKEKEELAGGAAAVHAES
jgi:hypothetical protein